MSRPRVYVAYTGGTIGMTRSASGWCPEPDSLQRQLERFPALQDAEVPEFEVHQYDPLLDSADMGPRQWRRIARDLEAHQDDHDGFVVLHGTDTMAYTASALSFMLEDLDKPVVVTGSQIPLAQTRNDARDNLLTSLITVGRFHEQIAEVLVCFHHQLFRGNRVTKTSAEAFDAFASPNLPPLGEVGVDFELREHRVRRPRRPPRRIRVQEFGDTAVGSLRLFPGMPASFVRAIVESPIQGLVLECYGSGNAPSREPEFLQALREASDRGVLIVAVTQPLTGHADLERYATGRGLLDAGVVSGQDMTTEAALTKLQYLFSLELSPEERRRQVGQDLRGELSPAPR